MIVTGPTHHVEKDTEMSGSGVGINHADMGQLRGLIDLAGRASCLALSGQNVFCCGSPDMDYIRLSQSFVGKAKYLIWKIYS